MNLPFLSSPLDLQHPISLNLSRNMKVKGIKTITWYAIVAIILAVAVLPLLKASAPQYFPSMDGFRNIDCAGINCPEGQFCQSNQCHPIAPRYTNSVPMGNL